MRSSGLSGLRAAFGVGLTLVLAIGSYPTASAATGDVFASVEHFACWWPGMICEDSRLPRASLTDVAWGYPVDDTPVEFGRMEGYADISTWTMASRSVMVQQGVDRNRDGMTDLYWPSGGVAMRGRMADNFTVTDVTDPRNPQITGAMGTTLFMSIHVTGSLLIAGSQDGNAYFNVFLHGTPCGLFTCTQYGAAYYGLEQRDRGVTLSGQGFPSLPPRYDGTGVVRFDDFLRIDLCKAGCPNLGDPIWLQMAVETGVGLSAGSPAEGDIATVAESDFGGTFSVSFDWGDPSRTLSITSVGGFNNLAPIPEPSVCLMLLVGLLAVGWRLHAGSLKLPHSPAAMRAPAQSMVNRARVDTCLAVAIPARH